MVICQFNQSLTKITLHYCQLHTNLALNLR